MQIILIKNEVKLICVLDVSYIVLVIKFLFVATLIRNDTAKSDGNFLFLIFFFLRQVPLSPRPNYGRDGQVATFYICCRRCASMRGSDFTIMRD